MGKDKIGVEQVMNVSDVAGYLEDLARAFRDGRIVVSRGMESMILSPPPTVEVEVQAKDKKDKQKFSLEISWKKGFVASPAFAIGGDEPAS